MIDFLKKLFGHSGSSSTAKERLRLVLMTDHLELAPDMIDAMKRDLVDVISRYVEVDREKIEVNFEQQDRALAMLANIPILAVNRPKGNGDTKHDEPKSDQPVAQVIAAITEAPEPAMSVVEDTQPSVAIDSAARDAVDAASPIAAEPETAEPTIVSSANAGATVAAAPNVVSPGAHAATNTVPTRRRRRRKRASGIAATTPAPAH
jgi:cell division topological specificity factor